ncbi:Serine/arginine-rich splicing factor RSZ21A [Platanthera guangdongensis]|uniref:Serine/arginine-rich splicing factor RSZ21A n=1 Tax=Platanthera guangdongensis TaxID=2320717 RepID=A0ABR2MHH0_9ASPA
MAVFHLTREKFFFLPIRPEGGTVTSFTRQTGMAPDEDLGTGSGNQPYYYLSFEIQKQPVCITKMQYTEFVTTMSRVYVGNLEPRVSERDLEDDFRVYGVIRSIWVARRPPGYAFIDFEDHRDANDAIRGMDEIALVWPTSSVSTFLAVRNQSLLLFPQLFLPNS